MNNLAVIPRRILAGTALGAVVLLSGCGSMGGEDEPAGAATRAASLSADPSAEALRSAVPSDKQPAEASAAPSTETVTESATEPPGAPTQEPTETAAPSLSSPAAVPTPAAAEPATVGTCTAAMLTGRIDTPAGAGAMGSVYRSIVLTNTTTAPCSTAGFPGVSAVDAAGKQIGLPADRDGSQLTVLTLAPGASATATLKQGSGQNYGADCGPTPVAGLRVYPPGATDSLVLEQHGEACSATTLVLMTVGTLQPAQ